MYRKFFGTRPLVRNKNRGKVLFNPKLFIKNIFSSTKIWIHKENSWVPVLTNKYWQVKGIILGYRRLTLVVCGNLDDYNLNLNIAFLFSLSMIEKSIFLICFPFFLLFLSYRHYFIVCERIREVLNGH